MNFFAPIPKLIRRTVLEGDDKYFLQVITYCNQFNYKVSDEVHLSEGGSTNGNLEVEITIIQDDDLPTNEMILPLVHQIPLGVLPLGVDTIDISLTLNNQQNPGSGEQLEPAVTISTVDAEEETRPIEVGRF